MNYPTLEPRQYRKAYGLKEASNMYSVSVAFLRKSIRENKLKAKQFGGRVLLLTEDLDEFFKQMNEYKPRKAGLDGVGKGNRASDNNRLDRHRADSGDQPMG
jgi:excisionase family DNA binding protein